MLKRKDVIIIGAGAAGLMCAIEAGARGRRVLVLDQSNKAGKKILMSGGGRCNFTHLHTTPAQYISHNPHFCKSALSRYTPHDFLNLVKRHSIRTVEKTPGQLFCEGKANQIVEMLLHECAQHNVSIKLNQRISSVTKKSHGFCVSTNDDHYEADALVVATGGLSIPTLGSSPLGYQIAEQFGIKVYPTRAGLVPITLHTQDKLRFASLSGISVPVEIRCHKQSFHEDLLFTHRGLSGPAVLQISSYWQPGDPLTINFCPDTDGYAALLALKKTAGDVFIKTHLSSILPKRLLDVFFEKEPIEKPLKQCDEATLRHITNQLHYWTIKPNGTEGYRTAEVTLGGVDCDELSSQRFEAKKVSGLFFIGEVIDVTGWLGGYNFQWAWSSAWAAGQVV